MTSGHFNLQILKKQNCEAPAGKEDPVKHQQGKKNPLHTSRERKPCCTPEGKEDPVELLLSGLVKRHRTCSIGGSSNIVEIPLLHH